MNQKIVGTVATWIACSLLAFTAYAADFSGASGFSSGTPGFSGLSGMSVPQPLPVEEAFILQADEHRGDLLLRWTIAPGHYLYRDKFKFTADGVSYHPPELPPAEKIHDPYFGETDVYYDTLTLVLPIDAVAPDGSVTLEYMGCAEAGLCYPSVQHNVPLTQTVTALPDEPAVLTAGSLAPPEQTDSSKNTISVPVAPGFNLVALGGFFLLGLGLAFTPCVFPMYPILTSIIAGQHAPLSSRRAAMLSFSYVQGMALTYAAVGLVIASLGAQVQGYLQHPATLILASVLFVLLALSMFGMFSLSLPARWQEKINEMSNAQRGGQMTGVFLMGALSGLIASPCTTAPLSAVLLYVAQSGDLLTGFATLYVLSLGMGLPLFLLGCSGGKLLPKAGAWMNVVKVSFGFALLFVPLMLLERIVPFSAIVIAATMLVLAYIAYLYGVALLSRGAPWVKSLTVLSGQVALSLMVYGHVSYWQSSTEGVSKPELASFEVIDTLEEFESRLAQSDGKPTLVDLYADWCVACKEFEHLTFPDPDVQRAMSQMNLIKVDLTSMNEDDRALMKKYQVLGLPTMMIFDQKGAECTTHRIAGFMKAEPFSSHLTQTIERTLPC